MNVVFRLFAIAIVSNLLTACGIGGFWMEGNPFPTPVKPYLHYWEKSGMTEDRRLSDWLACGGDKDGDFSWKSRKQLAGESNEQSSRRQRDDHQRCMIQRGYRYTGKCSDPDMKSRPLCGAP